MPNRPTIDDVARTAGVSKGAVSFALNGRPGVARHTRNRILAAAADLGWTPSHRGRALSASRALAVGMVVARPPETLGADPFFPAFIAGIETVLAPLGQALVLQVVAGDDTESYRRLAAEGRVDGVFLTDLSVDDPRPGLLAELQLPAVLVGPDHPLTPFPSVCVDDRAGVTAAVEHLIALGHQRIAHVSGPADFVHSRSRQEAWASALERAGLQPGPCVEADFTAAGGADATTRLLAGPQPPTAIVYANDVMALAGISAAAAAGVRVPVDLSVAGFDDIALAAAMHPPLTTVRTDVFAWGRAAATCLLSLIDGERKTESTESSDINLPPAQLVVRESTAPPRTEHP